MDLSFLSKTKTIWFTFSTTIFLTICFGIIMLVWDFVLIDEMYKADQIAEHIRNMTPTQRRVHMIMTATIDVLYPFAYASFFVGVALKAFPGVEGTFLSLPSILCVPTDLLEGYSQVMLLAGYNDYMSLKTRTTPIKLFLFTLGLVITIAGIFKIKYYPRKKKRRD
mmetsp:Transcript_9804/g.11782  ORF Transcript_9804/g.11782 Transcript_9804/m.11782 type:complete len:166 (+) Transcript_9804:142-639(+)